MHLVEPLPVDEEHALYFWAVDVFLDRTQTYYCIARNRPLEIEYGKNMIVDGERRTQLYGLVDLADLVRFFERAGYCPRNQVHPDLNELQPHDIHVPIFEVLASLDGAAFKRRPLVGRELRELRQYLGMEELKKVS